MNPRPVLFFSILICGLHAALAEDQAPAKKAPAAAPPAAENPYVVRVRFVPGGPPEKGSSGGASWMPLGPGPGKETLWVQAHAGVGDKFPVADKKGTLYFEVAVTAGDDDHLVLEIRTKESTQKLDLPRDKSGAVEIGGKKYEILYPSVSVSRKAGEDHPTSNTAMIIITCAP